MEVHPCQRTFSSSESYLLGQMVRELNHVNRDGKSANCILIARTLMGFGV